MTSYSSLPPSRTSSRSKKPSNYAKLIEEYHQQFVPKSTKKLKTQPQVSNDIPISSGQQKKTKKFIPCVLPDGKHLNLQILFSRAKISKPKPIKQKPIQQPPSTQKKPKVEQNNLLSKFLFAFQQIEKKEKEVENQSNKNITNSAQLPIQNKKEPKQIRKRQKDEDDKFIKFYERIKKLDQKFMEIQETLVLL